MPAIPGRPDPEASGSTQPSPQLVDDLAAAVGRGQVLVAPDVTAGYLTDWTGRFRAAPAVVIRPATTNEAATVVRLCSDAGVSICPQGGNTGLVGASVPMDGGVVVSTTRLRRLDPVDDVAGLVTAGAGVTLGELQRHAREAGLAYGVDLAARDSATVGGTIATNAGGNKVIRYGMTRDNVVGVEVVLADGSILDDLVGLRKDNTGYHLPGLFCGSEGTLGLITAATFRLHRAPLESVTALLAFDSVADAMSAVGTLIAAHLPLEAIEFMLDEGVELVRSTFDLPAPFDRRHAAYLLVECADAVPITERMAAVVGGLERVEDVAVAGESARRLALWRYRELHAEAVAGLGPPLKLDVSVPVGRVGRFVETIIDGVVETFPGARVWLWGHAGDGNVHVNVTGLDTSSEPPCASLVLDEVLAFGGSVSAEHGIGRIKRQWLERQRGATDLRVFRAMKTALDPKGVFQPGVLLPDGYEQVKREWGRS